MAWRRQLSRADPSRDCGQSIPMNIYRNTCRQYNSFRIESACFRKPRRRQHAEYDIDNVLLTAFGGTNLNSGRRSSFVDKERLIASGLTGLLITKEPEEPDMKRVLFILFAVSVSMFGLACSRSQNANQPLVPAAAANKPVTITITYVQASGGNPERFTVDAPDDGIRISKGNKDTIKWKVKYVGPGSANAAHITLDSFTNEANPSETDPFGDGSTADNTFQFDQLPGGPPQPKDTKPAIKGGGGVAFRYTITIQLPDNGPILKIDPVVVIDD